MKICRTCKIEKPESEFQRANRYKDGLYFECSECKRSKARKYRAKNVDRIRTYQREYKKSKFCDDVASYDLYKKKQRSNYALKKLTGDTYYQRNKERVLKQQKEYVSRPEVRESRRKLLREYSRSRCNTDASFRLSKNMRVRIWHAINGNVKSVKTEELIGCSIECLKAHLQSHFSTGMSWDNYGKWHVDHIRPCAMFDMSSEDEQRKCFHYTNLQPMWREDNLRKSDKLL